MGEERRKRGGGRIALIGAGAELGRARAQLDALGDDAPEIATEIDVESLRASGGLDTGRLREQLERAAGERACDTALACLPGAMTGVLGGVSRTATTLGMAFRVMPTLTDVMLGRTAGAAGAPIDLAALIGREPRPVDEGLVREAVAGKRVLITGAGGSIGSELAGLCAGYGPSRLGLMDRSENALFEIDRRIGGAHPGLARVAMLHDVIEAETTRRLVADLRPQIVFHAAAHKHVPLMENHPCAAVRNNLFGTKSIADASLEAGASRFVMISTDKAVNPTSVMGATKRLAELYVRSLNGHGASRFCLVRFGNVLGSACSVLPIWAGQIGEGGPVTVTHEAMTRYFMTIPEAAALVVQASALGAADERGGVFVLDMGEPVRIIELAERFVRLSGFDPVMPGGHNGACGRATMPIVVTGIRPGEKLSEELAHEAESLTPTRVPGVLAWTGEAPARERVEAMIEELGSLAMTDPAEVVVAAIARQVRGMTRLSPEHEIETVDQGSRIRVGSHAA